MFSDDKRFSMVDPFAADLTLTGCDAMWIVAKRTVAPADGAGWTRRWRVFRMMA